MITTAKRVVGAGLAALIVASALLVVPVSIPIFDGILGTQKAYAASSTTAKKYRKTISTYYSKTAKLAKKYPDAKTDANSAKKVVAKAKKTSNTKTLKGYLAKNKAYYFEAVGVKKSVDKYRADIGSLYTKINAIYKAKPCARTEMVNEAATSLYKSSKTSYQMARLATIKKKIATQYDKAVKLDKTLKWHPATPAVTHKEWVPPTTQKVIDQPEIKKSYYVSFNVMMMAYHGYMEGKITEWETRFPNQDDVLPYSTDEDQMREWGYTGYAALPLGSEPSHNLYPDGRDEYYRLTNKYLKLVKGTLLESHSGHTIDTVTKLLIQPEISHIETVPGHYNTVIDKPAAAGYWE